MSQVHFPPELWLIVFELLSDDRQPDEPHPILPLALVCKEWKEPAQYLIYHSIELRKLASVPKFLRIVVNRQKNGSQEFGDKIKSLAIFGKAFESPWLPKILTLCSNVESFTCDRALHYLALWERDISVWKHSLITLDATVGLEGAAIDASGPDFSPIIAIGRLKSLRTLRLRLISPRLHKTDLTALEPWHLPYLSHLTLAALNMVDNLRPFFTTFFGRCRFPVLRTVQASDRIGIFPAVMKDFFGSHPQITRLRLDRALGVPFLKNALPSLRILELVSDDGLDAASIQEFPPLIQHLSLFEFPEPSRSRLFGIYAALTRGACPFQLRTLQIQDEVWTWRRILQDSRLRDEWLSRATELHNRGIVLLDRNGDDAFTVKEMLEA